MALTMLRWFFFSSRRRHTRCSRDWSSDVCSSDLDRAEVKKIAPRGDDDRRGDNDIRIGAAVAQRLPQIAEQVLEHEARDAGPGVQRAQNEQRLEHDREVIPECDDGASAE